MTLIASKYQRRTLVILYLVRTASFSIVSSSSSESYASDMVCFNPAKWEGGNGELVANSRKTRIICIMYPQFCISLPGPGPTSRIIIFESISRVADIRFGMPDTPASNWVLVCEPVKLFIPQFESEYIDVGRGDIFMHSPLDGCCCQRKISKPLCLFTKGIRVNAFGIHRAGKKIFPCPSDVFSTHLLKRSFRV
eukprot:sb/3470949/